jgi:fimbrial chaperone protein
MKLTGLVCTVLSCLAAATAAAGSFSVSPTRIEFDANRRTAAVTLRNASTSAPLTIQASLVDWEQAGAEDTYTDTRDLLATPPVFTIPPGGEQVLRIALRRAQDARNELPYRIFFQEVPQPNATVANTLNIALRVGVPVFVRATRPDEGMYLKWQVARASAEEVTVFATNSGGTHVQVTGFELLAGTNATAKVSESRYVLPNSRVSWTIKVPAGTDLQGLRVDGKSDMGDFAAEVEFVTINTAPPVRTASR